MGSQRTEPYKLNALVVGGLTVVCLESDMCDILCHNACGFHYISGGGFGDKVIEFCN